MRRGRYWEPRGMLVREALVEAMERWSDSFGGHCSLATLAHGGLGYGYFYVALHLHWVVFNGFLDTACTTNGNDSV